MAGSDLRRGGWVFAGFALGIVARSLGAGVLFWATFPLWLSLFWAVQGFPPALSDLPRWYAVGAFNATPVLAMIGLSPLVLGGGLVMRRWRAPVARRVYRRWSLISALLYALLAPPVAYALLLMYAEMWQYRAWDVMMPNLLRAYLLLAPACGMVGALIGWLSPRQSGAGREQAI